MTGRTFWAVTAAMAVLGAALRLAAVSGFPDNDDAYLFIRGVVRFSVVEGRPHWFGYPVYIAVGKLAAALAGDPVHGLQAVSAIASAAVAVPLAGIGRRWADTMGAAPGAQACAGWAAAALWLVSPASSVTAAQIVSDPLGLLFGTTVLALCLHGEDRREARSWLAAAVLAGVMLGVRLVNVTMLGPLVWKAWVSRGERWGRIPVPAALALALTVGVLPWLATLFWLDTQGYVAAGRAHVSSHFTRFGESLFTDPRPLRRPATAFHTLAVYGLGAGTAGLGWLRVAAGVAWLAALVAAATLRPWRAGAARMVALWVGPHLAYVFVGHDVAFPRYMLSAALFVSLAAGLAAAARRRAFLAPVALVVLTVLPTSVALGREQARHPPVEYAAARYLARQPRAVVVSTGVDLIAIYLPDYGGDAVVARVAPGSVAAWRRRWRAQGRPVFATQVPDEDPEGWVPVARFCRDALIEPLAASELWLFRSLPGRDPGPFPACGETR